MVSCGTLRAFVRHVVSSDRRTDWREWQRVAIQLPSNLLPRTFPIDAQNAHPNTKTFRRAIFAHRSIEASSHTLSRGLFESHATILELQHSAGQRMAHEHHWTPTKTKTLPKPVTHATNAQTHQCTHEFGLALQVQSNPTGVDAFALYL